MTQSFCRPLALASNCNASSWNSFPSSVSFTHPSSNIHPHLHNFSPKCSSVYPKSFLLLVVWCLCKSISHLHDRTSSCATSSGDQLAAVGNDCCSSPRSLFIRKFLAHLRQAGVAGAVVVVDAIFNRETRDALSMAEKSYLHTSFRYTGGGLVLTALAARSLFKSGYAFRIMAANPC